jgi:hypothetical protein
MTLTAAVLAVACLAAHSAGDAVAAGPGSARSAGAVGAAPIAWSACGPRGARVRPDPRAARLGPSERAHDPALVIRHLASDPERRIGSMLINPG